jgi:hypothetical protein
MKPCGPLRLFRAVGVPTLAFLLAGACLLSCGRSDLVDSVDPGGSVGGVGGMGGAGGAGGSGGAVPDLGGLCTRACTKLVACFPGALTQADCVTQCVVGGMQTCPNFADIFSKTDQCLSRTSCVDLTACLDAVPACQGSTGPAGGAGTNGTTSNAACQSVCTRAATCCKFLAPTSDCGAFTTVCATSSDAAQTTMACQTVLTAGATFPQGATVCK